MKIKEELIKTVLNHMVVSLEDLSENVIKDEINKNVIVELIDIVPHKNNNQLYKKYTITFQECNQLMCVIEYVMRLKELIDVKIT